MFGQPAKVGLASSNLPKDIINKITSEEDLEKFLSTINTAIENTDIENVGTENADTNADTEYIILNNQ